MSDMELTRVEPAVEPKVVANWKEQIKFDFTKVSARRIRDLNKGFADGAIDDIAKIYAEIIVACPPEWGAPNNPDSYIDLDFYGVFRAIVTVLNEAGKNVKQS